MSRYDTVYYATVCRADGSIVRTLFDYDYKLVMVAAHMEWAKLPENARGDIVVTTRDNRK